MTIRLRFQVEEEFTVGTVKLEGNPETSQTIIGFSVQRDLTVGVKEPSVRIKGSGRAAERQAPKP